MNQYRIVTPVRSNCAGGFNLSSLMSKEKSERELRQTMRNLTQVGDIVCWTKTNGINANVWTVKYERMINGLWKADMET